MRPPPFTENLSRDIKGPRTKLNGDKGLEVHAVEEQGRALLLSLKTSEDFRAGSKTPAAKTSEQWGQATKPPVARLSDMRHPGSSATRLTQRKGWEKPPGEAGSGE